MEKRKKHLLKFFFLLLFSMTLSCGGGGGGSETNGDGSKGTALTITDVRIFRPSTPDDPIEPTNGTTTVYLFEDLIFKVYYSDPAANVDWLYLDGFYPSTSIGSIDGFQVENIGQGPGTFVIEAPFFRKRIGEWRLEFQLEDSAGNKSNIFDLFCEVGTRKPTEPNEGTAPIIKDVVFFRPEKPEEPIYTSNGSITVNIGESLFTKIYYEDPDVDIDTIYRWSYYPSTNELPVIGPILLDPKQSTAEDIFTTEPGFAGLDIFGTGPGQCKLDFLAEDSFKNQSDVFTVYVNVTNGAAPIIKDILFFRPETPEVPIDASNGSVTVTIGENFFAKIFYEDQDVNVSTIYRRGYYPSTSTVPIVSGVLNDVHQSAVEDILVGEPASFAFGEGEWRIDFQLEDALKNQSEIFTVYFNVIAP